MALAQRMSTFGSNHPGLNFLTGLVIGTALMATATFAVLAVQSDNKLQVIGIGDYSAAFDAELEVPRVLVSIVGTSAPAFPDAVLEAPRITVGQLPPLRRIWPSDENELYVPRLLVS